MIIYRNNNLDPYFNLAAEEYLIDNSTEPVFMLWRNAPAVIIGKNQNAYAEVNEKYLRENSIALVRRLTGGGAVFHDPGNVNFTFIVDESGAEKLDFARFTKPLINALADMGVNAELSGRNDIVLSDGRKISGNAQCVRNGKIMHHGTLLFSADLSHVSAALKPDPDKIKSKGINSVRSRVANIADVCPVKMDVGGFIDFIESRVKGESRVFSEEQIGGINKLVSEKYSTWEWNWGRSKQYSFTRKKYFPFGLVSVELDTDRGRIADISIRGDFFGKGNVSLLENALTGQKYEYANVSEILGKINVPDIISGALAGDILGLMF